MTKSKVKLLNPEARAIKLADIIVASSRRMGIAALATELRSRFPDADTVRWVDVHTRTSFTLEKVANPAKLPGRPVPLDMRNQLAFLTEMDTLRRNALSYLAAVHRYMVSLGNQGKGSFPDFMYLIPSLLRTEAANNILINGSSLIDVPLDEITDVLPETKAFRERHQKIYDEIDTTLITSSVLGDLF